MNKIEIIELPKIYDPRGCLSVAEENIHIPFEIKKVEWNHIGAIQPDAPIELGENPMMLIALAGEITIQVIEEARTLRLTRPNQALILGKDCKSSIIDSTKHSLLLTIHQK
ncbi:MAG: WxcM-like domain-containing protein [Prevotella sp.]|nr:WxcM-like domain-containing protein [Prevotella sp.]